MVFAAVPSHLHRVGRRDEDSTGLFTPIAANEENEEETEADGKEEKRTA